MITESKHLIRCIRPDELNQTDEFTQEVNRLISDVNRRLERCFTGNGIVKISCRGFSQEAIEKVSDRFSEHWPVKIINDDGFVYKCLWLSISSWERQEPCQLDP